MANKLKLLPPMFLNDEDPSESRVRENRLHGLMRGGSETVIGFGLSIRPLLPTLPRFLVLTGKVSIQVLSYWL